MLFSASSIGGVVRIRPGEDQREKKVYFSGANDNSSLRMQKKKIIKISFSKQMIFLLCLFSSSHSSHLLVYYLYKILGVKSLFICSHGMHCIYSSFS